MGQMACIRLVFDPKTLASIFEKVCQKPSNICRQALLKTFLYHLFLGCNDLYFNFHFTLNKKIMF